MMPNDSHVFEGMTDPRRSNATRHDLHDMLMMNLLTVLSGGETCADMAPFGCRQEDTIHSGKA